MLVRYHELNPELTLNTLRVLVAHLQKLDSLGMALPIKEIKQVGLIEEGLTKCLHLDRNKVYSTETIVATLKALTLITFTFP